MPKRSEKRDTAKAEYVARKAQGEKVSLRELAQELGVTYQTLRNWKAADKWDEALPKKKRGGQPGNKNSAGKKNAAGSHPGAPVGNKNAEKDGAYSAVLYDLLTDQEKAVYNGAPTESAAALAQDGMECRIFDKSQIITALSGGTMTFGADKSGFLSVFSHTDRCTGVTLKGLKYELEDAQFSNTFPLGVSNEFLGKPSAVTVETGIAILIFDR